MVSPPVPPESPPVVTASARPGVLGVLGSQAPPGLAAALASAALASSSSAVAASSSAAALPASVASATSKPEAEPPPPPKLTPYVGPLLTFYDALRDLEAGRRKKPVRVMWLGDSHAQADFWTGELRRGLQARFGDAGPGFVHLGFKAYRHNGIRFDIGGKWRMRPKAPSTSRRWGDGAFGLGGILHAGFAGMRHARMEMRGTQWAKTPVVIDLCYKFGLPYDRVRLFVNGKARSILEPKDKSDVSVIRHLRFSLSGLESIEVRQLSGRTDFCGVVVEAQPKSRNGVVLDNLGINGARYGTALAWEGVAWAKEVMRRTPELFIFEYGGNEASDIPPRPALYQRQAIKLIRRSRYIRRDVSCVVIGPSDRADAEDRIPPIVEAVRTAAEQEGCMFWDTYAKMGGKGSLRSWRDDGRASEDGVHLKPKGYVELGRWLFRDLMADYRGER
ncbi:MAG: GDSL-type esterase/lipase family protein [Polyangiaceae bacterium]